MTWLKDYDTQLNEMLLDYINQNPSIDISQGSLVFIKSACLASALWGMYKYQDWISKQIFPDTADAEYLEHHAWTYDVPRTYGESDAALLARLLSVIRRPPAGGNKYDYERWAKEVDNVADAWCIPIPSGVLGTVDVIVLANETNTGSEIPSSSARISVNTSVSAGKLVDSGATFDTGHTVAAGDIAENPLRELRTSVVSVDSDTQLTLNDDIFEFSGDPYIVHCQCGTNTSTSAGKLIDSAGTFDDATYTVLPGDIVENVTDGTETTIISNDSDTQLTLSNDIFTATGKTYLVRGLVGDVKKYIDPLRPVTASKVSIVAPTISTENVTIAVTGSGLDKVRIADDIEAYLNNMISGQVLYLARIIKIAMDAGADNITISAPATDITPTAYEIIRPGTISVS